MIVKALIKYVFCIRVYLTLFIPYKMIHAYHYLVLKYLIRKKKKGDVNLKLTNADRIEMVRNEGIKISETHIHRVLNESGNHNQCFNPYTLDQLALYIGYSCWNDFLKQNPLPYDDEPLLFHALKKEKQQLILKAVKLHLSNKSETIQEFSNLPITVNITINPSTSEIKLPDGKKRLDMRYIVNEKKKGVLNIEIELNYFFES
jgi:hypothetical protein